MRRRTPRSSRYVFTGQHTATPRPDKDDAAWRAVRRAVLTRDEFTCQRCRTKVENTPVESYRQAHIDHIIPLARGGHATDMENLQTLCKPCNELKGKSMAGAGKFDQSTRVNTLTLRPGLRPGSPKESA